MLWSLIAHLVTVGLRVLTLGYTQGTDKELEWLVLRQPIRILERRVGKPVRASRVEQLRVALGALPFKERAQAGRKRFDEPGLIFKPASVLKWQRELVKRQWTFERQSKVGKPRMAPEWAARMVRLATENPGVGYAKLQGERVKLGDEVGISTVRDVLKRQHISPAPERDRSRSHWRAFLNHYQTQMLACDCFTIETVWLKTMYVLFFIDLNTRRVYLAGCTKPSRLRLGHAESQTDGVATPRPRDPDAVPDPGSGH